MARTLKEILEEAKEIGGRYVFSELSEEDAKVLESHSVKYNVLYPVGSRRSVNGTGNPEIARDFSQLRPDLKKSYDFWNGLNHNEAENSGPQALSYHLTNIDNQSLLVEGKRSDKVVFKGIDHGRKGFDIVKTAELPSCEQLDRIVKRARLLNPKTVIRIKDNVTDPVLRNKMLIACALNNVKPVGNLPEDFDFAALRDVVRQTDVKDYDALAEILYADREVEFSFGSENTVVVPRRREDVRHENTERPQTIPVERHENPDRREPERKDPAPVVVPVVSGRTGGADTGRRESRPEIEVKKESWGRRAWRKAKGWIIGGAVVLASVWGYKSCEKQDNNKEVTPVEVVAKPKINSLADLRNPSTLDYLLNDWNKDGQVSVEDFQGVDWNNDGMLDFRDNELAHKIFEIVKKYRQAKDCADAKLLDSIEKEMDALVKKNCGEEKKNVRRTPIRTPAPQVVHDTVYVKGDTVYLQPDTVYLKGEPQVVHDTVYIREQPKQDKPVLKQDNELRSGRKKGWKASKRERAVVEEGNRTVEVQNKDEDFRWNGGKKVSTKSQGRTLTPGEISKLKKEHTK